MQSTSTWEAWIFIPKRWLDEEHPLYRGKSLLRNRDIARRSEAVFANLASWTR